MYRIADLFWHFGMNVYDFKAIVLEGINLLMTSALSS
jgi:hypothetical protein